MKIKYPAVLVATLVHFFLGGLWYSPLLFANKFMQLINWTPEQLRQIESESHVKELVIAFVMSLILVYVLAHFVQLHESHQRDWRNSNGVLVVAGLHCDHSAALNSLREKELWSFLDQCGLPVCGLCAGRGHTRCMANSRSN